MCWFHYTPNQYLCQLLIFCCTSSVIEQNTRPLAAASTPSVAAELVVGNVTLRLFNGADQNLIRCAMQCMGGATRAW